MLIGLIRPVESQTVTVKGHELDDIKELIAAQTPPGWRLVHVPVSMSKNETMLTAHGHIERRDGLQEIHAEDMSALEGQIPEGYQLLSVRAG